MLPGRRYLSGMIVDVDAPISISPISLAKSAATAVGAVIRHGIKKVSDEEKTRRLEICHACEFLIHKEGAERCAKCGCFLKWKTALEAWHCPIKKW